MGQEICDAPHCGITCLVPMCIPVSNKALMSSIPVVMLTVSELSGPS